MKIYFAGSIRGGRQDQGLYLKIISILGNYGTVLTEHVGDAQIFEKEKNITDRAIFEQDTNWLQQADVVVAEVTTPSLGVGYEIGIAEASGKPTLCMYRNMPERRLSAMIAGNSNLTVAEYSSESDFKKIFDDFLTKIHARKPEQIIIRNN